MRHWPMTYQVNGTAAFGEQLRQTLENFGFISSAENPPDITFDFTRYGEIERKHAPHDILLEWQGMNVCKNGAALHFNYQGWRIEIDVAQQIVFPLSLEFGKDDYVDYQCRSFLRIALLFLVRRLGYFELHAGACALDDLGYVFIGSSGQGKTSAVLSLVESGWKYVGDDALLASLRAGGSDFPEKKKDVWLVSARHRFSLTAQALENRHELRSYASRAVKKIDKWVIDPLEIWPDRRSSGIRPAFIVFCSIQDAEETCIAPVAPAVALSRLLASTPWIALDRETSGNHIGVYCRLAETCRSFELRAGRDALRLPQILADLLSSASVIATYDKESNLP